MLRVALAPMRFTLGRFSLDLDGHFGRHSIPLNGQTQRTPLAGSVLDDELPLAGLESENALNVDRGSPVRNNGTNFSRVQEAPKPVLASLFGSDDAVFCGLILQCRILSKMLGD